MFKIKNAFLRSMKNVNKIFTRSSTNTNLSNNKHLLSILH